MFDREFFSSPDWQEKVREFSADHDDSPLRVVICTRNGSRYDAERFRLADLGLDVFPRAAEMTGERMMVFLPFRQIAQIEVSSIKDRREIGFSGE